MPKGCCVNWDWALRGRKCILYTQPWEIGNNVWVLKEQKHACMDQIVPVHVRSLPQCILMSYIPSAVLGVARILTVASLDAAIERTIHTSTNPALSETNIGWLEKSRDTPGAASGKGERVCVQNYCSNIIIYSRTKQSRHVPRPLDNLACGQEREPGIHWFVVATRHSWGSS
jgi:hypothetical protein